MFITIISTVKMIFLSNKKVKKDFINQNTTSIYSKEKLNQVSILNQRRIKSALADLTSSWSMTDKDFNSAPEGRIEIFNCLNTIDNNSYYFDIDNCVDELQLTHISSKIYVYG
jgi:hypothetical protein